MLFGSSIGLQCADFVLNPGTFPVPRHAAQVGEPALTTPVLGANETPFAARSHPVTEQIRQAPAPARFNGSAPQLVPGEKNLLRMFRGFDQAHKIILLQTKGRNEMDQRQASKT